MIQRPQTASLSTPERNVLRDCEGIIERGLGVWRDVGDALAVIRDRGLFRETHVSFDAYARDRWKIGKSRAYQLMAAAAHATDEESAGRVVPSNEHRARLAITRHRGPRPVPDTPEVLASRIARVHTPEFVRTLIVRLQEALNSEKSRLK